MTCLESSSYALGKYNLHTVSFNCVSMSSFWFCPVTVRADIVSWYIPVLYPNTCMKSVMWISPFFFSVAHNYSVSCSMLNVRIPYELRWTHLSFVDIHHKELVLHRRLSFPCKIPGILHCPQVSEAFDNTSRGKTPFSGRGAEEAQWGSGCRIFCQEWLWFHEQNMSHLFPLIFCVFLI